MAGMEPVAIADVLVPRLLSGEAFRSREVAEEFRVTHVAARAACRIARDVLLDKYNVVLPIANYHGEYILAVTTRAADAFYGEIPQLRALHTRSRNLIRRLNGVMALVKTRPRMASRVLRGMESNITALHASVDIAVAFMEDELEAAHER